MSQHGEAPGPPGFSLASPISISSSSTTSFESERATSPQREEVDRFHALLTDLTVIRRSRLQLHRSPSSSSSSPSVSHPDYIEIDSDSGNDADRDTLSDSGSDDSISDEVGESDTRLAASRLFLEDGDSSSNEEDDLDEDDNSVESEEDDIIRSDDEIEQDDENSSDEDIGQDAEVANEKSSDEETSSDGDTERRAEVANEETDHELHMGDNRSEDDTDEDENVSDEDDADSEEEIQDSSSEEAIADDFDEIQEDDSRTSDQSNDEHESSASSEYRPDHCPPGISFLGSRKKWIITRVGSRISLHQEWVEPPLVNDPLSRYPSARLIGQYRQLGEAGIPYHGRFHTQVVMEKHNTQPLPFPLMTPRQILLHQKRKRTKLDEAANDSDYEDGGPDGDGSDDSRIKSRRDKPTSQKKKKKKKKKRAKKSHHANAQPVKLSP